jgi:hypothetical protein
MEGYTRKWTWSSGNPVGPMGRPTYRAHGQDGTERTGLGSDGMSWHVMGKGLYPYREPVLSTPPP